MLEYAKKYEEQLQQLFSSIAFDPFYQFCDLTGYREPLKLPDNTFNSNHFVSIVDGKIIGYIEYQIKRAENSVWGLRIIHFGGINSTNSYTFGKDTLTAVKDVFEKYGFFKIQFVVVIGNPIEKTYDKLISRFNGKVVGINRKDVKLLDGKLYDVKNYEIFADDYFAISRK